MQSNRIKHPITLEVPWRDYAGGARIRRVQVSLGEPFEIPSSGERRRRLVMMTRKSDSRGLVEADVSWDAVLAEVEMFLALEDENRKEAAS